MINDETQLLVSPDPFLNTWLLRKNKRVYISSVVLPFSELQEHRNFYYYGSLVNVASIIYEGQILDFYGSNDKILFNKLSVEAGKENTLFQGVKIEIL